MDWIHKLLNFLLPPATLVALIFLFPICFAFKFVACMVRYIGVENVAGKVVLITGASSGIGEHLAYEYARRGAKLALVARREDRLRAVANECRRLGSSDVAVIRADVSKVEECKLFVEEAIDHFGQLDHLVNNAGIVQVSLFEDYSRIVDSAPVMDTNFWGSVYATHFAIPHLRKSKGKIIVIASVGGSMPCPRISIYAASKAALISFYETLRIELGSNIGITIVNLGLVQSEMANPQFISKVQYEFLPAESTGRCAKAIVKGACRGERCLTEPSWYKPLYLWKSLCPDVVDWSSRFYLIIRGRNASTKD